MVNFPLCLLLWSFIYLVTGLVENGRNVETSVFYRRIIRSSTSCGFLFLNKCYKYTTESYKVHSCKSGYRSTDGIDCPHDAMPPAICDGEINPTGACNTHYNDSHIVNTTGSIQYNSGGTCQTPEQCVNCNQGFYPSPNRCLMCSPISNCTKLACTNNSDEQCSTCVEEYTPIQNNTLCAHSPEPTRNYTVVVCAAAAAGVVFVVLVVVIVIAVKRRKQGNGDSKGSKESNGKLKEGEKVIKKCMKNKLRLDDPVRKGIEIIEELQRKTKDSTKVEKSFDTLDNGPTKRRHENPYVDQLQMSSYEHAKPRKTYCDPIDASKYQNGNHQCQGDDEMFYEEVQCGELPIVSPVYMHLD